MTFAIFNRGGVVVGAGSEHWCNYWDRCWISGFSDGACRSMQNLSSAAWALFAPDGELVDLQGIFLGRTTNNIVEYSAVIELLSEVVALGIRNVVVKLDSQLVVLQLNNHY